MKLLKKWWFWLIIIFIVAILFISLYFLTKKEINYQDVCGKQGCLVGCGNRCVPWEVGIRESCPAPTENFTCECINNKCVKTSS